MLVDSHCHLDYPDYEADRAEVIARAHAAGVGVLQTICVRMGEFARVLALAESHERIYCSVGVHPHESGKEPPVRTDTLVEAAAHPKVIGIGETGLDYYYEHSDRASQQESFRRHIAASQMTGLPLIVHTRDAEDDTLAILQEAYAQQPFPILIHCFTSTQALAEAVLELGGYISISGIITFKNATTLQEVVRHVPLERLLVETDAPYLAPIPYRGKRNEPAHVAHTNAKVAELLGIHTEDCATATTDNFFRLFTKASRPATHTSDHVSGNTSCA